MKRACAVALGLLLAVPAYAARDYKEFLASGYATINAAVNAAAAAGGGVVKLDSLTTYTSGTHFTVPLIIHANVTLRGMGPEASVLQCNVLSDTNGVWLRGDNSSIEHLKVKGNNVAGDAKAVVIGHRGTTQQGSRVYNCDIEDFSGWGIYCEGVDDSASTYTIKTTIEETDIEVVNESGYDLKVGTGNTTLWARSCQFGGVGGGVLDKGIGTRLVDCVFEAFAGFDRVGYQGSSQKNAALIACYFECTTTTATNYFIELTGEHGHGLTVRDCVFVRSGINTPKILRTAVAPNKQSSMVIDNPLAIVSGMSHDGTDIVLRSLGDEAVIIGGSKTPTSYDQTFALNITARVVSQPYVWDTSSKVPVIRYDGFGWPMRYVRGGS